MAEGTFERKEALEEEYRLAQQGTTLYELSLEYQEKYQQKQGMLVTMALAQLGYNATSRALYGPAFNAATAYSPDSRLDQIEKTGVDPGGRIGAPAPSTQVNPLENIKYTDKVIQQMGRGDHHSFPQSVDAFGAHGTTTQIIGGDGIARIKVEIPGSYMGKDGMFQYIIEPDGVTCNHRLFVTWSR